MINKTLKRLLWYMAGVSPTLASRIWFFIFMKKTLHLKNPLTLNEKILWLKLNTYRNNSLVTTCSDKIEVREYAKSLGLSEILVPLYNTWENVTEIEWDSLPKQFVIKCNHGCGYNIFCQNKDQFDIEDANRKLDLWLKTDFWRLFAEINYKNIKPRILCEEYLFGNNGVNVIDYKVYCFNGKAAYVLVCVDRQDGKPKFYFFDKNWKLARINPDSVNAANDFYLPKPKKLEEMMKYASVLSNPFPFVRVDFYLTDENVFLGEMTFTPSAGFDIMRLPETDLLFGEMVDLKYSGG